VNTFRCPSVVTADSVFVVCGCLSLDVSVQRLGITTYCDVLLTLDGVWIGNRIYWILITRNYK
jgi:hypothetical protein